MPLGMAIHNIEITRGREFRGIQLQENQERELSPFFVRLFDLNLRMLVLRKSSSNVC
jgi:hypothetical protein